MYLIMTERLTWQCPIALSKKEELICKKLKTTGKLFVFLRQYRHIIFNDEINARLISMYHDHPKGKPPIPAAQLAMATILQAYEQKSDAGATLDAMFDIRWRMVLNSLDCEEAPFSQGTLCDFRHRLIKHNMDEVLLSHTVDVAKKVGGFSYKSLRVALDSAPLQGCGRVEDTFNLVAHALELLIDCIAAVKHCEQQTLISEIGAKYIGKSSIKAALDIDWSDTNEKANAITHLMDDVNLLRVWLTKQESYVVEHKAFKESLQLLETVLSQNIEPDPDGGARIKQGVSQNRLISITDQAMKHGRKSSSRTINGFKQHIAIDMEYKLILATSVRPANEPEHHASIYLKPKVEKYGHVNELSIDRGYLAATWTLDLHQQGYKVIAKPWTFPDKGLFTKKEFKIDLINKEVECPAGNIARIQQGKEQKAKFKIGECQNCDKKTQCTRSSTGRVISIHKHEDLMQDLKEYTETVNGRAAARERVKVEHSLASICNRKGHRARYRGLRLNEFDLSRTAMITNLHISMNLAA